MTLTDPYKRMVARMLASHLEDEIRCADEGGQPGTFAAACHMMSPVDYRRFLAEARRQLEVHLGRAGDLPPQIRLWVSHLNSEDGDEE